MTNTPEAHSHKKPLSNAHRSQQRLISIDMRLFIGTSMKYCTVLINVASD